MADFPRVAVYIDFDNVVISRYDHVFEQGAWRRDDARRHRASEGSSDPVDVKLWQAAIDISAIVDYASSFGTVALTKAYADWSAPANAAYQKQLVDRAVDLIQLFTTSGMKNGADIRLSIDAIGDLNQQADITHVVVVAGDSDYIALAQRCKQMGRYVVGIGVAESTSRALKLACNEFTDYAQLPGVSEPEIAPTNAETDPPPASKVTAKKAATKKAPTQKAPTKKAAKKAPATSGAQRQTQRSAPENQASELLVRAMRVQGQNSDDEWLYSSGVKSQMQRMDSTFKEKSLGYRSFKEFVESRADIVDTEILGNGQVRVRLR